MRTNTAIFLGVGLIIIMILGFSSMYKAEPLTVVYALEDGDQDVSIEVPNPPYSYDDGGVLRVDISPESPFYPGNGEGLSPESVYVFNDAFYVKNNATETGYDVICVKVTSNSDNIGVFQGDYTGSWSDSVQISLNDGESVGIGMRVDTHGIALGDYWSNVTIEGWGGACG